MLRYLPLQPQTDIICQDKTPTPQANEEGCVILPPYQNLRQKALIIATIHSPLQCSRLHRPQLSFLLAIPVVARFTKINPRATLKDGSTFLETFPKTPVAGVQVFQ